ncbi:unnamed protein product [Acanthosepion pharaonis]|uniref:VWFA domain-containing protein n=1 Tax=Acanthosepion pharaonis TaxID=158019 RepID=A0A812AU61_ACAPH|nr:unnamed protein product [Sepia pharaonis]
METTTKATTPSTEPSTTKATAPSTEPSTTKATAPSTEPSTTKATAPSTEPSTTNHPKVTMTPNRKQEAESAENIPISYTSKTRTRIFPTTETTTLRTNKPQTTMASNPLESLSTRVASGHQENIATKPSTKISSTVTIATVRKQKTENIPVASTPELMNKTSSRAYTTTTEVTPPKSVLGDKFSVLPGNIAIGNVTEIPQKDYASTVVFGFDLTTMGPSRAKIIIQFISHLLPHIGYDKFALVSNALCTPNFNIPLQPAINEDLSKLLPRLNEEKRHVLVDIIRQMNKELFKEANFKNDKNPKRQIGVLFVDPSVSTITSEVLLEAGEMKKKGFELFVIAIGNAIWTDPEMFAELSSQPHHEFIISVPTYNNLLPMVKHLPLHIREANKKQMK